MGTKTKLYRKRMWAVTHPEYLPSVHSSAETAQRLLDKSGTGFLGRIIPVLVSEIPAKSRGRK
jgi:hypothetical protein